MVERIQEFVRNKKIVFVGNSVEIMKHKLAKKIDSYDIVVRFGRAMSATSEQEKSIGKRCDIWVTGQFRAPIYKTLRKEFDNLESKKAQIFNNENKYQLEKFKPEVLREYDIRGIVDEDFPDEVVINLGRAYGKILSDNYQKNFSIFRKMSMLFWIFSDFRFRIQIRGLFMGLVSSY